jgi:hypothetical protein
MRTTFGALDAPAVCGAIGRAAPAEASAAPRSVRRLIRMT